MRSWAEILLLLGPLVVVALLAVAFGRLVWLLRHGPRSIVTDRPLVFLLLWLGLVGVYTYGLLQGGFFVKDYPEDACGQRLTLGDPPTTISLLPLVHRCNAIGVDAVELVPPAVNPLLLVLAAALVAMTVVPRVRRASRYR